MAPIIPLRPCGPFLEHLSILHPYPTVGGTEAPAAPEPLRVNPQSFLMIHEFALFVFTPFPTYGELTGLDNRGVLGCNRMLRTQCGDTVCQFCLQQSVSLSERGDSQQNAGHAPLITKMKKILSTQDNLSFVWFPTI